MPPLVTIGRILFVLVFVFSGASKFTDIAGTTAEITAKVIPLVPAMAAQYVTQVEALTSMPIAQLFAILAALLEVVGGLLIALNVGTRFFAWLLILFTIVATYCFHDFWSAAAPDKINNMVHALKNLSLVGGLLILAGYPRMELSDSNYTGTADNRY